MSYILMKVHKEIANVVKAMDHFSGKIESLEMEIDGNYMLSDEKVKLKKRELHIYQQRVFSLKKYLHELRS